MKFYNLNKFLLFFAIFIAQCVSAQVTISGNRLVKDGQEYKFSKYKEVFTNPEAKTAFSKARTNSTVGQIFAYAGGFGIGFGLIPALQGNKTETRSGVVYKNDAGSAWTVVGIGAGLVAIGIPFAIASNKNAQKALTLENGGETAFQPYFKLETAGNGMALSYNF